MVCFNEQTRQLLFYNERYQARATLDTFSLYLNGGCEIDFSAYPTCRVSTSQDRMQHEMRICFQSPDESLPKPVFQFSVNARGITMKIVEIKHYTFHASGHILYGGAEPIAINTKDTPSDCLRSAIGPAAARYDNAVYDKQTDTAFVINGCRNLALGYDFEKGAYRYTIETMTEGVVESIHYSVKKELLTQKYDVDFVPMKKRGKFDVPPAGWMTWYSVKFGACEEVVLRNARFQKDALGDFGANIIWVDWEWCHQRYERERFDGVDNFHPDPNKYPNGLGYVADEIKKIGLTPALWMGFTNDVGFTAYEKEHPEISLSHHDTWSGRYYYDMSHPEYLEGYLTKAVKQVMDWGYEAVKYDTLPNAIMAHENYHQNMSNPDLTTYSVYRNMAKKTRELVGEDVYMLSCGSYNQVMLWGSGYFDASRVGPDLFTWERFMETLGRIRQLYPLHSIVFYNDPDCVVLRDEYSTYAQAKTRLIPVSMLGLPLTFGDDLTKLPPERLDLLKRALPVMKVHPTDFNNAVCDEQTQLLALNVALPFENYTVIGFMNLTETAKTRDISLSETLRLFDGEYLAYDFFEKEFLGIFRNGMTLTVNPYDTRVIALRKKNGKPQLVSTSRHITQGAAELSNMQWNDMEHTLNLTANLVKDDLYTVCLYVPDAYRFVSCSAGVATQKDHIVEVTLQPIENGEHSIAVMFEKA